MIEPECHLWGEAFSPLRLREIAPAVVIDDVTEPGDIQTIGAYRGQPAPYGACCITTPHEVGVLERIGWMADHIALHKRAFVEAGATSIIYWLYWTDVQGNMEFTPEEMRKIADLEIPFCIDYIQE